MGLEEAIEHVPAKPTYVIRIFHPLRPGYNLEEPLICSPHFIATQTYRFSDAWPEFSLSGEIWTAYSSSDQDVLFDEILAERIVRDFMEKKDACEALLVHCSRGRNRSPAVAIAMNEVFGIGHDTEELKRRYDQSNWFVYKTLRDVGNRIVR